MLSEELELTLNRAFKEARDKRHEFMTVEHLLRALVENPTSGSALRACGNTGVTIVKSNPLWDFNACYSAPYFRCNLLVARK